MSKKALYSNYLQHLSMILRSARYLSQILDSIGHTYNAKQIRTDLTQRNQLQQLFHSTLIYRIQNALPLPQLPELDVPFHCLLWD